MQKQTRVATNPQTQPTSFAHDGFSDAMRGLDPCERHDFSSDANYNLYIDAYRLAKDAQSGK